MERFRHSRFTASAGGRSTVVVLRSVALVALLGRQIRNEDIVGAEGERAYHGRLVFAWGVQGRGWEVTCDQAPLGDGAPFKAREGPLWTAPTNRISRCLSQLIPIRTKSNPPSPSFMRRL